MRNAMEPYVKPLSSTEPNSDADTRPGQMSRRRAVENIWPYAVAILASAAYCWLWAPRHPVSGNLKDILSASSRAASSLFGFLLTSASILVGIKGSWYKQRAKEVGVYLSLVKRIFTAMWWCLVTTVLSIVGLSYDPGLRLSWYPYALSFWAFCAVVALGTTTRAIRLFAKLFLLIAEE